MVLELKLNKLYIVKGEEYRSRKTERKDKIEL